MRGVGAMAIFTARRVWKSEVWLEWGISLPLVAYQVAPCLVLPRRRGMGRGEAISGYRVQSQVTREL